jgi:hypothetical protein
MALDPSKLSGQNVEQLSLGLKVDEVQLEGEPFIDPAEAQRRSSAALQTLKMRLKDDLEKIEQYEEDQKQFLLTTKYTEGTKENSQGQKTPPPVEPNVIGWAEDFYFLLDHGWPWRVAVYIAWAGGPKMGRWPRTQEELAHQVLGLTSDRQIAKWRSENPAIDEMIGMMQAMPLLSHRRDMFEALATSASNPSSKGAQDRKLGFAMLGDFVPNIKIDDRRSSSDPLDKSDAELDEIIRKGGG